MENYKTGGAKVRCLITGAGFLGTNLIRHLLEKECVDETRVLDVNEKNLAMLIPEFGSKVKTLVGDIRRNGSISDAMSGIDILVHTSAMKHIDLCEKNQSEALQTNVDGTRNVLDSFSGSTFIGISTDKAIRPSGFYGATKLIMEGLILERAKRSTSARYMIMRSGNFFGSSGSVIEKWKREIEMSNSISVTDEDATRYFTRVDEVCEVIINMIDNGKNGDIFMPPLQLIRIGDIADAVIQQFGNSETKKKVIGLRPGDKKNEDILDPKESGVFKSKIVSEPLATIRICQWIEELGL